MLILSFIFLGACSHGDHQRFHDPYLKMLKEEYETKLMASRGNSFRVPVKKKTSIDTPEPLPSCFYKRISLSTSGSVPLKEIFLSLGQQSQANFVISPAVEGSAVIHVSNRPLIELIQDLCVSHKLRYTMSRQCMKIEPDRPYLKTYQLDFLILGRSNQNRFSIATDVFTGPENTQGNAENTSSTTLTAETKTDFWQEVIDNLDTILNVEQSDQPPSRYSVHKQGGLISVFATQLQHELLTKYLKTLRASVERQVLIEAKILEVNLKDEYKSGINWNIVRDHFLLQAPLGSIAMPGAFDKNNAPQKNIFNIGGSVKEVTGLLSLLSRFGTVRTLSNPRLTVINNQSAVLKVATNKVYFKLNYTRDYNYFDKREQVYVSSDVKTVPIGLVMVVQPCIRQEDGKIIMTLRPTISRVIQEVADPAVGIASGQKQASYVPEVQVRELDSVLAMNSGETVVVGGLMEERADNDKTTVPVLSDVPLLGSLFEGSSNERQVTELVIFLNAVIIDNESQSATMQNTSVSPGDENMYQNFSRDQQEVREY